MKKLWKWLDGKKTVIFGTLASVSFALQEGAADPKLKLIGLIGVAIFGSGTAVGVKDAIRKSGPPPSDPTAPAPPAE